jgi:twitching motility protein PilT
VLRAVISQRLLPRADGQSRVAACEILISTPFIRECIVDKERTHQIPGAIAVGTSQYGMQTFDQAIFSLFQHGLVSYEALRWASTWMSSAQGQGISTTSDMAGGYGPRSGRAARGAFSHPPVWQITGSPARSDRASWLSWLSRAITSRAWRGWLVAELSEHQIRRRLQRAASPPALSEVVVRLQARRGAR